MGILTRDQLLNAGSSTLPRETVHVAALGGDVCIQGLSVAGRDRYLEEIRVGRGDKRRVVLTRVRTKLLRRCIVDPESGEPLFTQDDEAKIARWRADATEKLFDVAQRLSGLAQDNAGDDEDEPEGSEGNGQPAGASGTGQGN